MKKMLILFLFITFSFSTVFAQNETDKNAILKVIDKFKKGLITKDSILLNALFFDKNTPIIGVMSVPTEKSVQLKNPNFQGLSVSDSKKFIREICFSKSKQQEKFAKIKIDIIERIATVSFLYAFEKDDTIFQWGHENWSMVFAENQWLITNINFTIKYPGIEKLPEIIKPKTSNR